MNSGTSSSDLLHLAYRLLKQDAYYDKMDLFLRANIATYESSDSFYQRQNTLTTIVNELRDGTASPKSRNTIDGWLKKIKFRLLPKSVELSTEHSKPNNIPGTSPGFISNVRTADKYLVREGGVQYFIDAPIELYLLSTVWCVIVGPELDNELDIGCFGNRLEQNLVVGEGLPSKLFKIFHFQYTKWRNTAIERAEELLEQGVSSVIVSLDIKQCYYHLTVDWKKIPYARENGFLCLSENLNKILEDIHIAYRAVISDSLAQTHGLRNIDPEGIPIGLPSSRILANWLLAPFDTAVREKLQPAYYGRYVDDMLIVAQSPPDSVVTGGANGILHSLLINRKLLRLSEDRAEYLLCCLPNLSIQGEKLKIQHFDKQHSRAGLKEFIKEIEREASDFRFLPADERGRELDACAYDILYEGSINKLRSVIGVKENSTELSKYLARRMIENRLTSEALNKNVAEQLDRFSRGKNLLDFCTTWESILTLLVVKKQHERAAAMLQRCLDTITRISFDSESNVDWLEHAKQDLNRYLCIALSMPLALLAHEEKIGFRSKRLLRLINSRFSDVWVYATIFRDSNLFRHQWVAWPLLNYTQYTGSLISPDYNTLKVMDDWDIDKTEKLSPRYIHTDERQLFNLLRSMMQTNESEEKLFFFEFETILATDDNEGNQFHCSKIPGNGNNGQPDIFTVTIPSEPAEKLVIGIANLHVSEKDISASYEPLRVPNTSWERQEKLFHLLNLATKEKCDMLVLPEVSVPYSWLPFMVAHARKEQIALVFGLEHWVIGMTAYNLIVTILPYKEQDLYRACHIFIRPKNEYSPAEFHELSRLDLVTPNLNPAYFLFNWRGTRFTVFNCFELSNIKHRAVLRSEIDFLISINWNKDTKYFSNIVESTVRDLHCYIVQVNTSQYGDSRVTSPKKSEEMNAVRVSGGLNTTLLKAEIDIRDLNDFRCKKPSSNDKRYKPTPAGFEHKKIRERG